jgi:kumamolisin
VIRVVALLSLLVAVSACAPKPLIHSAAPAAGGIASVPAPRDLYQQLLRHSRDLGRIQPDRQVTFTLLLKDPSAQRRAAAIAALYDPHSSHFGQYLSLPQWKMRFGPRVDRVQRVRRALRSRGVTSRWVRGDGWMIASGPARRVEQVFGVRIDRYAAVSGRHFWASRHDPVVPSWLRGTVAAAGHLTSYVNRRTFAVPENGLTPADLLAAYDLTPLRHAGFDGAGQTVSFVEIDGYRQADFDAFTDHFHLPPMHPQIMVGDALSNVDGEAELDLEIVHEIAPAARLAVYNCSSSCDDAEIAQLEAQTVRNSAHGIISESLGGCEAAESSSDLQVETSAFDQADALGESVFAASGDSAAYTCLTEDWSAAPGTDYIGVSSPAVIPGVTGVGGTRLSVSRDGSWYREEAWEVPPETAGTGGGVSVNFPRPSWQKGPGVDSQPGANGRREVPDVSADADTLTAAQIYVNGDFNQVGGTSQAAPIWAGMMALINQYLKQKGTRTAGFLNPALYTLAATHQPFPPFHDVTIGSNMVYPATSGYDMATGLGTPDAWNLARDLQAYLNGGGR